MAITGALLAYVAVRWRHSWRALIGWRWHLDWKTVAATPLAIGLAALALRFTNPTSQAFDLTLSEALYVALPSLLLVGLIVPLCEEILIRGCGFGALEASLGPLAAAVIVVATDVALHAPTWVFNKPLLGVLFAVTVTSTSLRLSTGSVMASLVFHASYNASLIFSVFGQLA